MLKICFPLDKKNNNILYSLFYTFLTVQSLPLDFGKFIFSELLYELLSLNFRVEPNYCNTEKKNAIKIHSDSYLEQQTCSSCCLFLSMDYSIMRG